MAASTWCALAIVPLTAACATYEEPPSPRAAMFQPCERRCDVADPLGEWRAIVEAQHALKQRVFDHLWSSAAARDQFGMCAESLEHVGIGKWPESGSEIVDAAEHARREELRRREREELKAHGHHAQLFMAFEGSATRPEISYTIDEARARCASEARGLCAIAGCARREGVSVYDAEKPARQRPQRTIHVKQGLVEVDGPLRTASVERALRPMLPWIERCYERELSMWPDEPFGGTMAIIWTIDASGVTKGHITTAAPFYAKHDMMARCVQSLLGRLKLEAAPSDSVARAMVSFAAE